jgi:type II secretion system (T2SS) protein E
LEQSYPPGDESGVPGKPEGEALSTPLRERPDAPLGTLIFRAGLLPAETIESALEEGVKTGKRLGEILTERGLLKEADLARLLAGQRGLEFVNLREQIVDQSAAGLFNEDQARLFRALPYAFEDGSPVIAIADPTDDVLTRNVCEALGREDAKFVVSVRSELADIIGKVYANAAAAAQTAPFVDQAPEPVPEADRVEEPSFVREPVPAPEPSDLEHPERQTFEPAAPPPAAEAAMPFAETPAPQPAPEAPVTERVVENPASLPDTSGGQAPEHVVPGPAVPEPVPYEQAFPEQPAATNGSGSLEHAGLNGTEPPPQIPDAEPVAAPQIVPTAEPVEAPVAAPPADHQPPEFHSATAPVPSPSTPEAVTAPAPEQDPFPETVEPAPVEATPVVPAPAPEPLPAAAAETTTYQLSVRLTNGERVEAGAYADLETAKQQAKALMAQVAASDGGDWPFVSGRFLKPDTIVSVDIL